MRFRHYLGMGLGALLLSVLPPGISSAERFPGETLISYQVQASTQVLSDNIRRKLSQLRTIFASIEVLLSSTADEKKVHQILNRMISGLPFIRAIIVIQGNGTLTFDSASLPAVNMDLSDRSYFKRAVQGAPHHLWIEPPVVGRSSGVPFLPIASRIPSPNGDWVIVAVVVPDALIDVSLRCTACSIALLNGDGDLLTAMPLGYRPAPYVMAGIAANHGKGPLVLDLDMIPSVTDWQILEDGNLTVMFTRFSM
jgi:hypothetical protein